MDNFSTLLPANWKIQVDSWLHEDIPSFDFGGFVVGV
jgi:nicotinate-nucleotide pyrophosphorylase (carboxylating)